MGAIWFRKPEFAGVLSEIAGYKAGLALSKADLIDVFEERDEWLDLLRDDDGVQLRIRSEEFELLVTYLLYKVGYAESPYPEGPGFYWVIRKYKHIPNIDEIYKGLATHFITFANPAIEAAKVSGRKKLDPTPFIDAAVNDYGETGLMIAIDMCESVNRQMEISYLSYLRRVEWKDIVKLEELFHSESLDTLYGTFFDQRFIDYIERNFDKIGEIHWRKFEGLAAEYFDRQGFSVEIGPGRDDGGIDIRVWSSKQDNNMPPLILVQCKRTQAKIDKVIVKALWADVVNENAESGFIVTTSSLSPGAVKVCKARNYPIEEVNRATLRKWLNEMRTPGKGVFLSE